MLLNPLVELYRLNEKQMVMNCQIHKMKIMINLHDTLCHPVGHSCHFPLHTFESMIETNRSFCSSWCCSFSWIHYNNAQDIVLCIVTVAVHI